MFNGTAWAVSRQGLPEEIIESLLGVQPSRVWAVIFNGNSKAREVWTFDGRQWAKMATVSSKQQNAQGAPCACDAQAG